MRQEFLFVFFSFWKINIGFFRPDSGKEEKAELQFRKLTVGISDYRDGHMYHGVYFCLELWGAFFKTPFK